MDELLILADRLAHLLKIREPGLMTWRIAVQDTIDEIAKHRSADPRPKGPRPDQLQQVQWFE